jgi:hypothetical protein
MRRTTLLALSLMLIGVSSYDSARAQSSANKPVSLVPQNALPPAGNRNAKPREPVPPVVGVTPAAPNPAADYDGFSASTDDSDAPSQLPPPARSRTAKDSGLDAQSLVDQEDEALKRKLTICKNCK